MSSTPVDHDLNIVLFAQHDGIFALAEGMDFDPVHARDNPGVLKKAFEVLCFEVGHAGGLHDSQLLSGLEGAPLVEALLSALGWRVEEVEVEVVQAELLEGVDERVES